MHRVAFQLGEATPGQWGRDHDRVGFTPSEVLRTKPQGTRRSRNGHIEFHADSIAKRLSRRGLCFESQKSWCRRTFQLVRSKPSNMRLNWLLALRPSCTFCMLPNTRATGAIQIPPSTSSRNTSRKLKGA